MRFSASLKYQVGDREVSRDEFTRNIQLQVFEKGIKTIRARFEEIVCAAHGEYPAIVVERFGDNGANLSIRSCCQELRDTAIEVARCISAQTKQQRSESVPSDPETR